MYFADSLLIVKTTRLIKCRLFIIKSTRGAKVYTVHYFKVNGQSCSYCLMLLLHVSVLAACQPSMNYCYALLEIVRQQDKFGLVSKGYIYYAKAKMADRNSSRIQTSRRMTNIIENLIRCFRNSSN